MIETDRLERCLLAAARDRRPVTYGALLRYFDRKVTRITVAALCRDIGRVDERLAERGGPELAVLVVRASDGLPGEGWFAHRRQRHGYDGPSGGPQARALVDRLQRDAYRWAEQETALPPPEPRD